MENNEDFEKEEFATTEDRKAIAQKISKTLSSHNSSFEELNVHLENIGDDITEKQISDSTELLKDLSEHINLLSKLLKVVNNPAEDVYFSDITVCEEFLIETTLLGKKIQVFLTPN